MSSREEHFRPSSTWSQFECGDLGERLFVKNGEDSGQEEHYLTEESD